MCHSRGLSNRINNLHERALRIVHQDKKSDFETLLKNDKSVTIHMRNLHYLVTEIYKDKNNISPEIMRDIFHFQENENYNSRSGTHLASRSMKTTLFGKETVSNLGAKIWSLLPEEPKNSSLLQVFKNILKEWKKGIEQVVHVGFVKDIFNTSDLSKFASYENSFRNPMRKWERITCSTILLELKT